MKKSLQTLLRQKAGELSREVSQWAERELQLGTAVTVSVVLRLEISPPPEKNVPCQDNFLDMPLVDFFTSQRCLSVVGDATLATRVRNRLSDQHPWKGNAQDDPELKTVGDLITFGRRRLFEVESIGKAYVRKIEQVLASGGLVLDA